MAAAVLVSSSTVSFNPFLIKLYIITADTGGLAITHGESTSPNMVLGCNRTTNPTATEFSSVQTSATVETVDFEAAAGTYHVYMLWFPQATGGLSTITTT